jgi:ribosomal protein S18 acetylase RimI-like enzyme
MTGLDFHIRRASPDDAAGITRVLEAVVKEREHSAIAQAWSVDEQRSYLVSLSNREAVHVAIASSGELVGYQSLDLYSALLTSMAHVAQLGTFLLPAWRGRGAGRALFLETTRFAKSSGYEKIVIQVRSSNVSAQVFYRRLGFVDCGRLARQVRIDDRIDDEVLLEYFL